MKNSSMSTGIKYDDAFELVTSSARPLGAERVPITGSGALNRVLTEDVVSDIDIPAFDKSTRDGFACRRADLGSELAVVETIAAGSKPQKSLGPNQCAKIMTGAVVPDGADCVIMVEYTETVGLHKMRFTGDKTYDNIRAKAEEVKKGDVVVRAGELLKVQHIAMLASVGCVRPLVSVQPRVGVIATGSELVDPAEKPAGWQVRNSNAYQLAAHVADAAAIATDYGIAVDSREAIDGILKQALQENDVVILSGGVSVGDYDFVSEILQNNDVELLFERIAVKPGRPLVFGVARGQERRYCFGLPGNPVSTFVTFELFVKPFLFKLMGHDFKPGTSCARLAESVRRKESDRDSWRPVAFDENGDVTLVSYHGSAHVSALCKADGLLCIRAGVTEIEEGTVVEVRLI